ncbi:MOSC domain-containing protein [Paenibacillus sp. FSL K6-3182]|uniref:MOSC domain-containing protein n=1 Tax=unclassified Paenibacillus TaxID=185978 RepID=UPI0030D60E78
MTHHIETAKLVSLNIGMPKSITHGSKEVLTGIYKQPSQATHALSTIGLEGDGQGDTIHHGGPDKAVCVYFEQRYAYWREKYEEPFDYGAFGENFTLSSWTEGDLCIGDIIQADDVILQVSQPRQPCYKLGLRHKLPELPGHVQREGYTGLYFRVLQEGHIQAGMTFEIKYKHPARKTVMEANRVMYRDKDDIKGIRELLDVKELAASWQEQLGARLTRLQLDQ